MQDVIKIFEEDKGGGGSRVGQEVNCMIEELGNQFERTLSVNAT